jgi:hypothetical protein
MNNHVERYDHNFSIALLGGFTQSLILTFLFLILCSFLTYPKVQLKLFYFSMDSLTGGNNFGHNFELSWHLLNAS